MTDGCTSPTGDGREAARVSGEGEGGETSTSERGIRGGMLGSLRCSVYFVGAARPVICDDSKNMRM